MKTPDNPAHGWPDKSGSTVPAYLRKNEKPTEDVQARKIAPTQQVVASANPSDFDKKYTISPAKLEENPRFDFSTINEQLQSHNKDLILNKLFSLYPVEINYLEQTWISSTRKTNDLKEIEYITIGTKKTPPDMEALFGWGAETKEEEALVKLSHEMAHVLQHEKNFEQDLGSYLRGEYTFKGNKPAEAYIYLYLLLQTIQDIEKRPVSKLASLETYHDQTKAIQNETARQGMDPTKALNWSIIEDLTELMGAYALGHEYFKFRLDNSGIPLEYTNDIARNIVTIFYSKPNRP